MDMITAENLRFSYDGKRQILDGISFSIRKGELIGLIGDSGSGKSTLCHILCGIIPAAVGGEISGSVRVGGRLLSKAKLNELAETVGFVMQDCDRQIVCSAVEDELAFAPENFCAEPETIVERVNMTLRLLGIEDLREADPGRLSGGQKQLVAIGSVLMPGPQVLIFDEPFSHLDALGRKRLSALLEDLRARGKTLIVVEHEHSLLENADRWLFLEDGHIRAFDTPDNVRAYLEETVDDEGGSADEARLDSCIDAVPPETSQEGDGDGTCLEIKNLTFAYGDAKAQAKKSQTAVCEYVLKDFCAVFPGRGITAVVGDNGVGKTTLARLIMGMLRPQSGEILADGSSILDHSLAQRGRLIGYVMQNPARQIFSATALQEVMLGLSNMGMPQEEAEQRADEYLRLFGLEHLKDSFPFTFSHGEKQRLVLAATLAMSPAYLLLDEPTASLDMKRKRTLGETLRGLDCGVIVISHDMKFIEKYCDRVVRMDGAKTAAEDTEGRSEEA